RVIPRPRRVGHRGVRLYNRQEGLPTPRSNRDPGKPGLEAMGGARRGPLRNRRRRPGRCGLDRRSHRSGFRRTTTEALRSNCMATVTPAQPAVSPTDPAWVPSPLYRMSLEQYEAMIAAGAFTKRDRVQLKNGYLVEKVTELPPHGAACDAT